MSRTHDDTARMGVPRSSTMGYGHASNWTCDSCKASSGIFVGRKRYRGGWWCQACQTKRIGAKGAK